VADGIRSFIAFTLPDEVKRSLAEAKASLMAYGFNIRWVPSDNIHLTLKFLGDIRQEDVSRAEEAMASAALGRKSITLQARGLGVFPGVRRPRVIWAGLAGDTEQIADCQADLELNLSALGFPREKRPFRSHLTLGRVKGKSIHSGKLSEAIRRGAPFASPSATVDRLVLYRSELRPTGAAYTILREAPFTMPDPSSNNQKPGG